MANFAKIGLDNKVTDVIVVDDSVLMDSEGNVHEGLGSQFLTELYGWAAWKQTFYDGTRKNYAGRGHTYDSERDAFIPIKPYPSWILDENTCIWEPPVAIPDSDNYYTWNESTKAWDAVA